MQTPKARPNSLEVPQRKSPATPRTAARQLKTGSDLGSSPKPAGKTTKDRSPRVTERRSPQSPSTEKKRPGRISELEAQVVQLQEDLKKAKEELDTSESCKKNAQQEAEDAKKQLAAMSGKLEETQQQLLELSASEDARVEELRKTSHDQGEAWQSELEAVKKQHLTDSAALASARDEIQRLKNQLESVEDAEVSQTKHAESDNADLLALELEPSGTLALVEQLKMELNDCRQSESQAREIVCDTQKQLDVANATADLMRSESMKALQAYQSLSVELEQSKAQEKSLEELVSKLQHDSTGEIRNLCDNTENDETKQHKAELNFLKAEIGQLRAALEASEAQYQEGCIESTLQIRSAFEEAEKTKLESEQRGAEVEAELNKAKTHIEELRANLLDKENELQNISEENEGLNLKIEKNQPSERESELATELKKVQQKLTELKASLSDKETQLESILRQNELLRMEISNGGMERTKADNKAIALVERAKAAEQDALMKLSYVTEEADKSSRRAARVTEQLDAVQAANTELENELRKLKVQSDQWRKAAEAAAAMLSTGGNSGKFVERTGSLDSHYSPVARNLGSPYFEDLEDDSPKKKNGNVLKKIGVLWKKGPK